FVGLYTKKKKNPKPVFCPPRLGGAPKLSVFSLLMSSYLGVILPTAKSHLLRNLFIFEKKSL
ncbi:MAG: hypothetical protein ACK47J_20465, partial [Pseudanabaena sp.]